MGRVTDDPRRTKTLATSDQTHDWAPRPDTPMPPAPAPTEPPSGADRFERGTAIGEGGMGTVYEAFDRSMRRPLAVKVLHERAEARPGGLADFVDEARLTGRLDHPNVVPVYDLGSDASGASFFAMKRVEGENLAEWAERLGPRLYEAQNIKALLGMVLKACDALSFAHAQGVLHLDVKPENIMVGSHGQVYVMDWGIAVECRTGPDGYLTPLGSRRGIRGSPSFMAPEQLRTDPGGLDERTDVYGLGATLYATLSGRPPFDGETDVILANRIAGERVANLADLEVHGQHLPPGLCDITMRALSKDKDARFRSVLAVRDAIERFLQGGGWFAARAFEDGQTIVHEGEQAAEAYIITSGACDVFKEQGGHRTFLRRMQAGELFGETAILTRSTRTASVVAVGAVEVLVITRDALEREVEAHGWLGTLVRALAERFRDVDAQRAELQAKLRERDQ